MNSFMSFGIHLACQRLDELGDPLSGLKSSINWEQFRPITEGTYDNRTEKGGHPNYDEVLMIKILVLQHWYSLSDQKMELEMAKNISFMRFLDFQEDIPDSTTIWLFKERLKEKEVLNAIWQELQRQLDAKGLSVKEGCIQDATLITSDPGRSGNKKRGDEAKTRRSKDGTWTKKGDEIYFGYKLHNKVDVRYGLIRAIKTTTASVHDSQIDLSLKGETIYRDKGYFGVAARGRSVTMYRATRSHPLDRWDKLRNLQISRIRAPGERPFAVIKTVFKAAHVLVTTVQRVHIKMMFTAFAYNLYQLRTLHKANAV
jgi:transposase, IS5 family